MQKDLGNAANRKAAEEEMARAEEEWDELISEIRRRNPRYASLRYPEPIAGGEVRTLLDQETAIVSFCSTPDRVLVFRLTESGIDVQPLGVSPASLEERVENYVGLISRDDRGRWEELARRLAADIVEPWRIRLPAGTRRLIIVPDGPLHSLPFESLPVAGDGRMLQRFVVSYAPSVTVLSALRRMPAPLAVRPVDVFVLANPTISKGMAAATEAGESFDLEILPFANMEAKTVFRFGGAGSELWLGAGASERRVKQEDLRRFGVLHFATHTLLSSLVPTRSALLLAADGDKENGFLQAREIYRLRLASDLVTLSSCRTAKGRILPGEGVQGIAQAFFHAGTRSVVASLWDVNDRRTAELMERFYRHLAEGQPKAEALASAKRDLLLREPNLAARYWAPFVLIGEPAGRLPLRSPAWWRRIL